MSKDTKEGVVIADEVRIQTTRAIAAAIRFVNLIQEGKIPPKSKLVCAEVGIEKNGEISDKVITLLAIPPDEKAIRPLEPDRLEEQREKVEKEGYNFRILGTQEIEMDNNRLILRDIRLDMSAAEDGRIAELRVGEKEGSPPETVATVTTDGIIINDWQGFREWLDSEAFSFQIPLASGLSVLSIKDVVDSEPFQKYLTKLARGEFPKDTAFLLYYTEEHNGEVNPIMAGIAALPDGRMEDLQENLEKLRKNGIRIDLKPKTIKITLPEIAQCVECGEPYTKTRPDNIYCSIKCASRASSRAYRRRQKEMAAAKK